MSTSAEAEADLSNREDELTESGPDLDGTEERQDEERRARRVRRMVLENNRTAFQHEADDLVTNGKIKDWFASLQQIFMIKRKISPKEYLEPILRTENYGRKFLLLLTATRSVGSEKEVKEVAARDIALCLLDTTPKLAWHGDTGETALHAAARSGVDCILQCLVKQLSDADKLGDALDRLFKDRTPLETAVSHGHLAAVRSLIHRDLKLKTRCSILSLAIKRKDEEVFMELLKKCEDLLGQDPGVLRMIVEKDATKAWKEAIKVKRFPSLLASSSDLLHAAVEHGRLSMVENIVELQPQLVAKMDSKKRSVLSYNAPSAEDCDQIRKLKHGIRKALASAILRELDPASARNMFLEANST